MTSLDSHNTLISIVVITYNSANTVIKTLISAQNQIYKNIELIISDDCSTDNTIKLCKQWMEINKQRFINTKIVTSQYNTGISANSNRGIKASKGEWIKLIAGDDLLLSNCIIDNFDYIIKHPDIKILFSKQETFYYNKSKKIISSSFDYSETKKFFECNAQEQFQILFSENRPLAPTVFFNKELFVKYPYNEIYKYMEDLPQWINLTSHGIKLYFMDKFTVQYYKSNSSVSNNPKKFFSEKFHQSSIIFFYIEEQNYKNNINKKIYNKKRQQFFMNDIELFLFRNKRNLFSKFMCKITKYIIKYFLYFD